MSFFFSVVLATYNEAQNLKRCLESISDLADEIVIVDGNSPDGTAKLAQKLGARVINTTNKSNFHINKQMAIDAARGELILQLDADEVVDPQLHQALKKLITELKAATPDQLKNWPAAWDVARKNQFLGRFLTKGGQYPDPVTRLFRKNLARLPQQDVHEQMVVDGKLERISGHLLHYANPTFSDYLRKFNTYTSFKAEQLLQRGVKANWYQATIYLVWKPTLTFLSIFLRHKGFVDGVPGFVFAAMSGLHHAVAFLKLWELYVTKG